jgi:ribonuclease HI
MSSKKTKTAKCFYYAVAQGHKTGIFNTWTECKQQIDGYNGARYKKFESQKEAETFIKGNGSLILGQFGITNVIPQVAKSLTTNVMPHAADALVVFTDGACKGNGSKNAKAGYAAVFPNHPHLDICEPLRGETRTNNRAEYTACIRALEQCENEDPGLSKTVYMYTDSQLLLKTVTQWIRGWKQNGWKKSDGCPILNMDLVIRLDNLSMRRKIIWRWVAAHTDRTDWMSVWNAKVDERANEACTMS